MTALLRSLTAQFVLILSGGGGYLDSHSLLLILLLHSTSLAHIQTRKTDHHAAISILASNNHASMTPSRRRCLALLLASISSFLPMPVLSLLVLPSTTSASTTSISSTLVLHRPQKRVPSLACLASATKISASSDLDSVAKPPALYGFVLVPKPPSFSGSATA